MATDGQRLAWYRGEVSPTWKVGIVVTREQVLEALSGVADPEIGRPITELDMVRDVQIHKGVVTVEMLLTVPGCPLKDRITRDVTAALMPLEGVREVKVVLGTMSEEQRRALVTRLRSGQAREEERPIAFWGEGTRTKAILVASGKGGVGKSSVTSNLAVAIARLGFKVGVVDCDVWGFSIPRMMGAAGRPVVVDHMVLPLEAHGVKVMSMGFFVPDESPVIWRGPMLHKAVQQFLTDVFWGEMDYVLADLPPGTGDVSISIAQFLPGAEMLVVTTPQEAAQKVAARAGRMTEQVNLKMLGVVENMSYFVCPDCGSRHHIFGSGGGRELADALGTELLGEIPIDVGLREGADEGTPVVVGDPDSPAARAILDIARGIVAKGAPSLVGKRLPVLGPASVS
ncbi:MAG: Mrp/NBP35 family ATP-binding protein [Acidobacteria bacterium]|nr:Mrp/NBP35 family ATP-binding protein [Acidobacteriota bacterium]